MMLQYAKTGPGSSRRVDKVVRKELDSAENPQQGGEGRTPLTTAVGLLLVLARLLVGITRMHLMCLLTRVSFPDNVTANSMCSAHQGSPSLELVWRSRGVN